MPTYDEILAQVLSFLRQEGRVAYRVLKRRFALDDEYVEDIKADLIDAKRVAVDEDGKVLVWVGEGAQQETGKRRNGEAEKGVSGLRTSDPGHWTPPHLAARILTEQAAAAARGATDGERKTITILFADIKDSTALIEDLDPEEARRLIDPALQVMMDAVHRYEGYVAQALGDGIFAFFGAPLAHEDHPQRALYAALRMQEEIKRYAEGLLRDYGINLQVRVGINTGEVVMRSVRTDDLRADYSPVGHSTHVASRLESLANGGSIVVSEQTYKLTEGYFDLKPLGAARVKGVTEPINIYEVLGVGLLRTRLQMAARRGLVRFVGRRNELDQIRRAADQAGSGQGQIVGVMGNPGVGKSRLFHEFKLTSPEDCLVLETFSVSHGKAYPYLPLIDLLKNYCQITPHDDERRRREKVGGKVLMLDRGLEDTLPYLFALLGIAEATSSLQRMDPRIRRQRTFAAIERLFMRESLNQPLVLIFEDLHWLDAETQAFLDLLSESLATARILLLVNYRPEYQHGWSPKPFYTQLRLDPLDQEEAQELLTALLGADPTLFSLKRLILEKTEGNPFFTEEIVQALAEQGALEPIPGAEKGLRPTPSVNLGEIHVPPTVQAVLASRIDRLPPSEKELLQTLAVIGKEFPVNLLRQVVNTPEEELHRLLAHLQAAGFIYEQPAFPDLEYVFKHALTQEVAYTSLLIEQRKILHERTARAIEAIFHSRLEDHYDDLAQHYRRSGSTRKAIEFLHLAGQQAMQRSASPEAINHFTAALELLRPLPDTAERTQQELTLQIALAASLQATKGPAIPEVERAYTRALELCRREGETPQLFSVLRGLWVLHHVRAELSAARELGEQLLGMAERVHDPALLLEAHRALGSTLLWQGEFPRARVHLEQSGSLYNPQQHHSLAFLHGGADPGVSCLCDTARALWFLGYPDQALQRSRAALTLAEKLSDPFSLGFALVFAAGLHQLRREGPAAQQQAETGIALAHQHGFASLVSAGTIRRGWALAEQGKIEEGLAQMHQGLTDRRTSKAELAGPYFLALQAEVYGEIGQKERALTLLDEALATVDTTGERRLEAELYRLKGEILLRMGERENGRMEEQTLSSLTHPFAHSSPEQCFLKAIDIARRQSARSLELRAVTSLSRLWQRQGKQAAARQMLAEICGWFSEGFDTADLRDAKVLLEELGN